MNFNVRCIAGCLLINLIFISTSNPGLSRFSPFVIKLIWNKTHRFPFNKLAQTAGINFSRVLGVENAANIEIEMFFLFIYFFLIEKQFSYR